MATRGCSTAHVEPCHICKSLSLLSSIAGTRSGARDGSGGWCWQVLGEPQSDCLCWT